MIIEFSGGKIVLSPFEVQARLNENTCNLYAMVEDIRLNQDALMLIADAGAVRWSLSLDTIEQFQAIRDELGIDGC